MPRCSRTHITQVLRGDANLTLETLVRFARETGGIVRIHIADGDSTTTSLDRPRKGRSGREAVARDGREASAAPAAAHASSSAI